ncbi:MAG: Dabb family protein [Bacteroidales bacterium]|nr:Dabb family protein [Bacteroidales bacterium]
MIKIQDFDVNEKMDKLVHIKKMLNSLIHKIPEIKHLETGINITIKTSSYDLVLITEFNNLLDLETYRFHPEHVKVIDYLNSVKKNVVAVDYEC